MTRKTRHPYLLAAGAGLLLACMVPALIQHLVPSFATIAGHFFCDGEFEFVPVKKVGYGVCDGERMSYADVNLYSTLVWSVVCVPVAVAVTWLVRRALSRR